jgi:hypothetical protein
LLITVSFRGVALHESNHKSESPNVKKKFHKHLKKASIDEWLLRNDNFVNWVYILDTKSWPVSVALTFGGKAIRNLAKRLQMNESQFVDAGII